MEWLDAITKIKKRKEVKFDNEDDCLVNSHDDFRSGRVEFSKTSNCWFIWFNGTIIDSFKTFKALEKRLDKLFVKWNLSFIETESIFE